MELKPLQDLKESELDKVPSPINARFWIESARDSHGRIQGLHDIWEQCIEEVDPHRYHWNRKNIGFKCLLDHLERGTLVLVFDLWPIHPINRAYVEKDGRWQAQNPFLDSDARRRFDRHAETLLHERRESEAYTAWHSPQPKIESEPVTGPGSRAVTLGPHAGGTERVAAAPTPSPVKAGLGDDVDQLVGKSPSLQKDLAQLKKDKWEIEYGPAGGGSTANREKKLIIVDSAEKGNPAAVTQTLAHEVGHATHPYKENYSSKAAYLKGTLGDEGAATLNNIKVQREIIANGGPDIGIAGNSANHPVYNKAYDQFLKDGNAAAAQQSIGAQFGNGEITSNTGQTYANYYGGWYDKTFPPTK